MKLRLIDLLLAHGFCDASCLSAVSNIHIPAIAFTALHIAVDSTAEIQSSENGRSAWKHCLPLLIGSDSGDHDLVFAISIQVAVPIGILLCLIITEHIALLIDQNNLACTIQFFAAIFNSLRVRCSSTVHWSKLYNGTPSYLWHQTILSRILGCFLQPASTLEMFHRS